MRNLLFAHRNSLCNVFNTNRLYKIHFWEIIDKSYFSEININISNICLEHSWLCSIFFSPQKLERKTENEMVHFLKSTIPDHILHNTSGEYLLKYVSLLQSPYFYDHALPLKLITKAPAETNDLLVLQGILKVQHVKRGWPNSKEATLKTSPLKKKSCGYYFLFLF